MEEKDCDEIIAEEEMSEKRMTALDALGFIKEIELSHMEQKVDYDYEENIEYSYHEAHDGTIEENFPDEIEEIEKTLKAFEIIKEKKVDVAYIIEHPEVENVFWYNSSFPGALGEGWRMLSKEEWGLLKEAFK